MRVKAFVIDRVPIKLETFLPIMKARYSSTGEFYREESEKLGIELSEEVKSLMTKEEIETHAEIVKEMKDFFDDIWSEIVPMDFVKASQIKDINLKRIAFTYIGPAEMFNNIEDKEKVDTYEHQPKNRKPSVGDTYHLWKVNPNDLGFNVDYNVFAIQCWCPSSHKEYWFTVDHREQFCQKGEYSAKDAAAWVCTCHNTKPVSIQRQGDDYSIELAPDSEETEMYHFDGDTYFDLIDQQT